MRYIHCLLLIVTFFAACGLAQAKNIDLSTVPKRDTVQLTIYNAEDLTLVRERRTITFKKGANPLQFSWANTLIDPTSVQLEFKSDADKLTVLDTTFPHDKPQMLYWNIGSELDGEAQVEISYFTSGISWAADYAGIADAKETTLRLEGFVTVTNNSGEDYEDAQVRLVVGTINLVEQIEMLARQGMGQMQAQFYGMGGGKKLSAMRRSLQKAEGALFAEDAAAPAAAGEAKQIVKEGLSEYFIFSIEGTETIPNTWSKRMRSFEVTEAPIKVEYRYWPQVYGERLCRMFLLRNDEEAGLGQAPLPDGVVRVFRHNGRDGMSFLAQESIKYIPIGDKIELNLGIDPEVVFDLRPLHVFRDERWMQLHGADVFHKVGGGVEIDVRSSVAGWDEHNIYAQRIRNYTDEPITLDIRRSYGGHVVFRSELSPTLYDVNTVNYRREVGAGEKQEAVYEVITKQGRNAKQNNVTLDAGPAADVPWLQ